MSDEQKHYPEWVGWTFDAFEPGRHNRVIWDSRSLPDAPPPPEKNILSEDVWRAADGDYVRSAGAWVPA